MLQERSVSVAAQERSRLRTSGTIGIEPSEQCVLP